jgi:hypothetical protein
VVDRVVEAVEVFTVKLVAELVGSWKETGSKVTAPLDDVVGRGPRV